MSAAPRYLRRSASFLLHYVRRRPGHFLGLLLIGAGASACAVALQYAMKLLVDAMATPDRAAALVWSPLIVFIVLIGAENMLWRLNGWLCCRTVVSTGVDIRLDLFDHLIGHAQRFFAEHFSGALGNRITATAGAVGGLINTFTWNILPPCTDFVGAVIVLSTVHWQMAVALVAFVALVAAAIAILALWGRNFHRTYAEQASYVGGELVDIVGNTWAVKAFSARNRERDRLARKFAQEADTQRRSWMYLEKTRVLHDICLWLMATGMLIWAVTLWSRGTITPGDVVVVSTLTFRILHGSRDLAFALVGSTQSLGLISETLRVIGQPHGVTDRPNAPAFVRRGGAIEFRNVTYAYPDGRQIFNGFSLRIRPGQRVGLVGPSGAGKSTLVGLIQRLDDPSMGQILVDGQPIAAVSQDSLRAAIAVVPQEIPLFHRSVMENIRYGRPDATDEEVYEAARHAYADAFIRGLPQGYDTQVGERGVMLSGGQRQRIGIARAFLKDAPILILDEATSALDTESELEIQLGLRKLMQGRTVVAVAHRLSTVASFDRVIVMVEGHVVEDGAPMELRRHGGIFDSLWRLQAGGLSLDEIDIGDLKAS
ncbi:ABC transporter ATP-binding protein [Arenibaculum pallidiluteum]|uniref:ABC transporter ATP-binding protein n=1 Tax=Arenibaculum pallidiluteum TaxID=2812559 RepID=UPI001A965C6A|nr:ABC transporter ATP-binding protein [Arenibaculum pallidiluteum]